MRRARERGTASLTAKGLDPLSLAVLAIADQRVDARIGAPEVQALRVGAANPSVSMRLGAPRRLLTSLQGRTGAGAGCALDEAGEASRQAGQSSGVRGFSRRGSLLRLAAPFKEKG